MKRKFQLYGFSLLTVVVVAIAGHYYASYHPPSHKDYVAAYLLALMTGFFVYLKLRKKYIFLPRLGLLTMRELESHAAASLSNEPETDNERLLRKNLGYFPDPLIYDHEFCYDRLATGFSLLSLILVFVIAFYFAWIRRYIIAGLMGMPVMFVIRPATRTFLDKSPQVKIADSGIWVKGFDFKPWEAIRQINIHKDKSGRHEAPQLELFLYGNETDIPDFTMPLNEIKGWKKIGMLLAQTGKSVLNNDY